MTDYPNRAVPFLAAFNDIEAFLRSELNAKKSDGFSWMVRLAERKKIVTPRQSTDLQEYADLRNAISHGQYRDFEPIAEPVAEVVAAIEKLRDLLLHPPLAIEVLGPQEVITAAPEDDIRDVLSHIRTTGISQFPVYDGGTCTGLLTTNTVARWVAADLRDNNELDARTVSDVVRWAENSDRPVFLPRDVTAAAAVDALTTPLPSGELPRAAIVTESGRDTQKPLRVISGMDVAKLIDVL